MGSPNANAGGRAKGPKKVAKRRKTGISSASDTSKISHESTVDSVFSAFDKHGNGRITRENIRSVASDHGVDLTSAELHNMIAFFDNSGTATLSRADFARLCLDATR